MSSYGSGYSVYSDPNHLSTDEQSRVEIIAGQAYNMLCRQDSKSMSLGDFIAELRDYDLRTSLIDAILDYMVHSEWVWLWKNRGTGETWISVYETPALMNDEDGDEDDYM